MAYHVEKDTGDLVINGAEKGIYPSPHLGIGDMKNLNINSFTGEAAVNYNRVNTLPVVTNGAMSATPASSSPRYVYGSNSKLVVGSCIVPSASTITNFTVNKPYWVTAILSDSGSIQQISLANQYGASADGSIGDTGTATFSTFSLHQFIQGADEYDEANNTYIYYLCDSTGVVWVNNPNVYNIFSPAGDTNGVAVVNHATGFGVSQGSAFILSGDGIYANFTKTIGVFNRDTSNNQGWHKNTLIKTPSSNTSASHYVLKVPDQNGSLYYCDSQFLGQIAGVSSQFSQMKVTTASSTTLTISVYDQGVVPVDGLPISVFAPVGGSVPGELTPANQYYIKTGSYNQSSGTFQIATSATGSAISVSSGTFYVTTFDPSQTAMTSFVLEALALPYDDLTTCIGQFSSNGLTLAVGTVGNNIYFWSPGTSAPFAVLPLPESNTHRLLNVDNSIYSFTGNKGNIYITNGSQLAGALTIPDYVANPSGTNQDPYFIWGDSMFLRGRVWFSIQDQNSGNTTGNCGGIWSFTPVQNLFLGQDQGTQLHLENQSSYATYNGVCDVLLASRNQQAKGPQYWSGWSSAYTGATFGIDFSGTSPYNTSQYGQIDTDIIPIGTFLKPATQSNIEYKLSRPLVSGEQIEILYRPDLTSSFTDLGSGPGGNGIDNTVGNLSYPFPESLQAFQWIQFRVKTTSTSSSPSFVPFTELRIHQA